MNDEQDQSISIIEEEFSRAEQLGESNGLPDLPRGNSFKNQKENSGQINDTNEKKPDLIIPGINTEQDQNPIEVKNRSKDFNFSD